MDVEYPFFREVIQAMESLYTHGCPLHHMPSATSLHHQPQSSQFFVTTLAEFERLKPAQVQEVFRHRHILVRGPPPDNFQFDLHGLSQLGSLTSARDIQGSMLWPLRFLNTHISVCSGINADQTLEQ